MNELLMTKGTPFRAKEIEAFISVAKVKEDERHESIKSVAHQSRSFLNHQHYERRKEARVADACETWLRGLSYLTNYTKMYRKYP